MGCLRSTKYETYKKFTTRKVHYLWPPIIFSFGILLYYLATLTYYDLPKPRTLEEYTNENLSDKFIAERARNTLQEFVNLGPKVVGSAANEQAAVLFLINKIKELQKNTNQLLYQIEYEIQVASGGYKAFNMINLYQTIQNVVVKLTPINSISNTSLLINSHFDTVPKSPGAGDAGTMVVVMLEILNILSKSTTALKHTIIFLFNGAEENPLQGSHAFITQHKWAKNVVAFINLDSAGNGGKEILFQSGPNHPWLISHYRRSSSRPFASTLAEELFQGGMIPSDTDFRIFRDYGKIPGLDFAHSYNGYVYHTKYDKIETIPLGTFQNTGDNILALTKSLANAGEFENIEEHSSGHAVFFDFLGSSLILYTEIQGIITNILISVIGLITICLSLHFITVHIEISVKNVLKQFSITFLIQLISICFGGLLTILMAFIIDGIGLSLFWYTNSWLIFGIYLCPLYFGIAIIPVIYLNYNKQTCLTLSYRIQLFLHSQCLILIILIIIFTSFNIRSTFLFVITVFFYIFTLICNLITRFHNRAFVWIIPHLIGQIIPIMFYSYMTHTILMTMIPMQGRSGVAKNPELFISGITIGFGILLGSFILPLFGICRKAKTMICGFLVITIVFIILLVTPVGFPYQEETAPQRFSILHSQRIFHNFDKTIRKEETGYFIIPMDRNTINYVKADVPDLALARSNKDDCEKELFCGLPFYNSRMFLQAPDTFWLPAESPVIDIKPNLNLISKTFLNTTIIRYKFEITGPDHMSILIRTINNSKLINWSFLANDENNIKEDNNKKQYYIYFSYGLDSNPPYSFDLDIQTSPRWNEPNIEIALVGHLTHYQSGDTKEYQKFLMKFPNWAHITNFRSSYESWRY